MKLLKGVFREFKSGLEGLFNDKWLVNICWGLRLMFMVDD
jgi:hypothetical protein